MPSAPLSSWTLSIEILAGVAAVGLAALLFAFVRRPFKGRPFAARLLLPASTIVVALAFASGPARRLLPVRPRFFEFVRAGLVFFAIVLVICLIDVSIQAWYRNRKARFPMPGVLHGFILGVLYLALVFTILKGILGINITPFLATSAILTAVLGLALQGVLGNILAGLSLHFTRSFSRGDWVKIGETEGIVIETNWRETRILDRASNMIVLPNNAVASGILTNFSQPDPKAAITMPLKVGYEAAPSTVLATLTASAREVADVAASPAPLAYILGYDDLGVSYLLKFWIQDYQRKFSIQTEVGRRVWYKFKRLGIAIPMPVTGQLARVLETVDRGAAERAAAEAVERDLVDLLNSSFLRHPDGEKAGQAILTDEEARALASRVRRVVFAPGETLFRQGEKGEACFVVAKGKVKGRVTAEEDGKAFASEFHTGRGGIVGEMSLFTGMPRTATVTVEEESELLEIGAAAFVDLLAGNPGLAESVAEVVSERNRNNLESLRKIKELSAGDLEAGSNKKTVLEYLKKLVGLFRR